MSPPQSQHPLLGSPLAAGPQHKPTAHPDPADAVVGGSLGRQVQSCPHVAVSTWCPSRRTCRGAMACIAAGQAPLPSHSLKVTSNN